MAEGRVRGFSVATKCATVDELIEKFRDRVDDSSILVNPVEHRDVGTECAFAILLADRKPALAGTCVVLEVYSDANNPFMRPGMRLGIRRLGPDSQRVFAQLVAKKIAPRKMTQALPVVAAPRVMTQAMPGLVKPPGPIAEGSQGLPPMRNAPAEAVQAMKPVLVMPRGRRTDASKSPGMAVIAEAPAKQHMPTVQPAAAEREEPLYRAPRATPFDLDNIAKLELKSEPRVEAKREPKRQSEAKPVEPARVETRTPGSPFILPANPLSNITDASLEGYVDCRLFEANASPLQLAAGTLDADEPVVITEPLKPAELAAADAAVVTQSPPEPLPLPPPPLPPATPLPYAATKLPDLNIPDANDKVRYPLLKRNMRNRLLLALILVPLVGAAGVVAYMRFASSPTRATTLAPASTATLEEPMTTRAPVEPAPATPVAAAVDPVPAARQPIHAVFVKSYPIAAKVTVDGRYFGTTPTYIKVPANTPVEVKLARPGFKPVTYPLTSKGAADRVFVRLERSRGRR